MEPGSARRTEQVRRIDTTLPQPRESFSRYDKRGEFRLRLYIADPPTLSVQRGTSQPGFLARQMYSRRTGPDGVVKLNSPPRQPITRVYAQHLSSALVSLNICLGLGVSGALSGGTTTSICQLRGLDGCYFSATCSLCLTSSSSCFSLAAFSLNLILGLSNVRPPVTIPESRQYTTQSSRHTSPWWPS